ncbi:hypothetical protein K3495_g6129 [Podosphaera aphanis]|nr:hypothetical protein K3495_g6129 [Podosphaera aphanis]
MTTLAMSPIQEKDVLGIWKKDGDDEFTIIGQEKGARWDLSVTKVRHFPPELEMLVFQRPAYLDEEVHVIISTLSGDGLASSYYDKIIAPLLKALQVKINPLYSTSGDSVRRFVAELTGTVILLSGDGGVNDLINNAKCRLTIILFPLGSGNAIYSSYIKNGLWSLLHGTPRPLPAFRVSFDRATLCGEPIESIHGAVIASYGFHPSLIEESDKCRELGPSRFERVAEKLLINSKTYQGTVNGEKMRGYAAATMVKKLDERFCVSPENEFRLIHTDTSNLMKGYTEGLNAWKVERVEIEACGKICVDGLLIQVDGLTVIEEVDSAADLVV